MKKTLVIHPEDKSTDFLCPIYKNIPDKTVVRGGISKYEVIKLIESHDRIMMMGHGTSTGLFNRGFTLSGIYIIEESIVPLLMEKTDSVFIWCNSDMFVKRHELKGFFSGMFVSELMEARYMRIPNPKNSMVDESNEVFSEIVSRHINEKLDVMYEQVRQEYGILAESNPIAKYNHQRLYLV